MNVGLFGQKAKTVIFAQLAQAASRIAHQVIAILVFPRAEQMPDVEWVFRFREQPCCFFDVGYIESEAATWLEKRLKLTD